MKSQFRSSNSRRVAVFGSALILSSPLSATAQSGGDGSSPPLAVITAPDILPQPKEKGTRATTTFKVAAPRDIVWQRLTDFDNYPSVFKRVQSCRVTKKDGDQVLLETYLKPELFVKQPVQHTVTDLTGKPSELRWWLVDGNFKQCRGNWVLKPSTKGNTCQVTYTIIVDAGPFIPSTLVHFLLHMVQKEAGQSLKQSAEAAMAAERGKKAAQCQDVKSTAELQSSPKTRIVPFPGAKS